MGYLAFSRRGARTIGAIAFTGHGGSGATTVALSARGRVGVRGRSGLQATAHLCARTSLSAQGTAPPLNLGVQLSGRGTLQFKGDETWIYPNPPKWTLILEMDPTWIDNNQQFVRVVGFLTCSGTTVLKN